MIVSRIDSLKLLFVIFVNYCFFFVIADLYQLNVHLLNAKPTEGTDVTLSCNFDGQPEPTISWTMNGSPLNTSVNSRISLSGDKKQLTITNVHRTDSGEYRCVASNSLGNATSNAAALSVQCKNTFCLVGSNIYEC